MSQKATVTVHPAYTVGKISPRLFSAFLEPIGTMVNGTMFNPKHPTADEQGFRKDVIQGLKSTGLPAVRLPGGNFVSAWQWKDSIGPMSERKVHLDQAWHQFIPNNVGHDEYLQWAEKIGTEPLYTVNFGTGTLQDAIDIVEYSNFAGGTYWSDLRKKNGHEAPYGVKLWYLGNEMDGPWQLGSWNNDPRGYGVRCLEASKAMKWIDESIETAVCGSSAPLMEHFPDWDETALNECYDVVDYLSIHHYHTAFPGDIKALLGGSVYYEDFINTEAAMIEYVRSKHRSPKQVKISFDEYGGMVRPAAEMHEGYGRYNMARAHYRFDPERKYILHDPDNMPEREFPGGDMLHMLSMASIQLALLRHADVVEIGCMTGGLGALCASNHDHVWHSASHFAFKDMIDYAKGTSMEVKVSSDTYDIPGYRWDDTSAYPGREGINYIDAAAAYDKEKGSLSVFLINRSETEEYPLDLDIKGFMGLSDGKDGHALPEFTEHSQIFSDDFDAKNRFEAEIIKPSANTTGSFANGIYSCHLKPLSWNRVTFRV